MLNEASWLLNSWLQDVQNLTEFFDSTNCRDWSVKTNPDWMHKSNALELVSSRVQPQKQEDRCKPKWQCKHKNGFESYRSFFCDRNNDRLLEINHDLKEGLNKNSNLLCHRLRALHWKIAKRPIVIQRIYSDSAAVELELRLNSPSTPSGTWPEILRPRDWWLWLSLLCMSLLNDCEEGGMWPPNLQAACLHLLYCFWVPTMLFTLLKQSLCWSLPEPNSHP